MGNEEFLEQWEQFLTPEILRTNLIMASVYIAAFEILKNVIVERIRDFYLIGFDNNGFIIDPEYKEAVLRRNRSPVYASLDWLKEAGAITDADIETFEQSKEYRNLLAHELARLLMEGLPQDFSKRFQGMVMLLDKIEKWWIVNVDIPTNPDFDEAGEIDEENIIPGTVINLQMILDIALGPDERAYSYISEFKKRVQKGY